MNLSFKCTVCANAIFKEVGHIQTSDFNIPSGQLVKICKPGKQKTRSTHWTKLNWFLRTRSQHENKNNEKLKNKFSQTITGNEIKLSEESNYEIIEQRWTILKKGIWPVIYLHTHIYAYSLFKLKVYIIIIIIIWTN